MQELRKFYELYAAFGGGQKVHELKVWPEYFEDVQSGRKPFEVRKNYRSFEVNDLLLLKEWTALTGYSGREMYAKISYILYGGQFGIEKGFCVIGLANEQLK